MKLIAGKYYRQRNGGKAYVAAVDETRCKDYQAIGWTDDNEACNWNLSGNWYSCDDEPYDLIAEWVEPPAHVGPHDRFGDQPGCPACRPAKRKVTMWVQASLTPYAFAETKLVPITVEVDDDQV